ncbi:hypothetical protein GCM10010358_67350 [Streptomyces minutiscleroticus]|uniref:H repeat-associated protein N-terminal domain-containing protein n=1 Tax=Streptomyces minutiscleroticus TaxID=68238 RepID=A0A918NXG8_9ACTN|nr:hypothetical protein GCM10010358_67350 [Streptomyces minutiscleroticus]
MPRVVGRLTALVDPRERRGRRHSLVSMLLTACCAVLAGARSYAAVGQWAVQAPQDALARLGVRATGPFALHQVPVTSTIRRVLQLTCPGGPADLLGRSPAGARQLAVDGTTARGSRTSTIPAAHLLSAVPSGGHTVASCRCRTRPPRSPALPRCSPGSA